MKIVQQSDVDQARLELRQLCQFRICGGDVPSHVMDEKVQEVECLMRLCRANLARHTGKQSIAADPR